MFYLQSSIIINGDNFFQNIPAIPASFLIGDLSAGTGKRAPSLTADAAFGHCDEVALLVTAPTRSVLL